VLPASDADRLLPLDSWQPGLADGVVWAAADGSVGIVSYGRSRPVSPAAVVGFSLPPPVVATQDDLGRDAGTSPIPGAPVDVRQAPAHAEVTMVGDRLVHPVDWVMVGYGQPEQPPAVADPPRP
jgi:hypothetical protein